MAATAGICTQTTKCQVAKSGRIVAIPLGESFVCPECGNGLAPPTQFTPAPVVKRNSSVVPLALVGVGLFILGGAIFVGRELGGGGAPAPASVLAVRTPPPPAPAAVASVAPAPAPVAPPAPVPVPVPATTASALPPAAPPATAPGSSVAAAPAPALQPGTPLPLLAPTTPAPTQLAAVPTPPVNPAAKPAPTPALKLAAPASTALALAVPPPAPVPAPAPEPPPAVAALPPDAPFSPVPETGGAPSYPTEMAADGRVGKVNVSCQISAEGVPSGCHATTRSGPAFATAVTAWLTHGHVKFHPIVLHGHPLVATRTWTVTLEEPPAVLAEARRKQKEEAAAAAAAAPAQTASNNLRPQAAPLEPIHAPVQQAMARQVVPSVSGGGPDVPFSSRTVAGGVPTFPAYYDEGRPGAVTVSCTIEVSGSPSGCHIVRQLGGSGFGKAVDQWLGSGRVRFRPILVNGQPVAKQETWTVIFNSMPTPAFGQ